MNSPLDNMPPESDFCRNLCADKTGKAIAHCALEQAIKQVDATTVPTSGNPEVQRAMFMQGFCTVLRNYARQEASFTSTTE
jgi:hypothetical protein